MPHGWELVRHQGDYAVPMPTDDDLVALANAVREAAVGDRSEPEPPVPSGDGAPRQGLRPGPAGGAVSSARRHLRVVSGDEESQR